MLNDQRQVIFSQRNDLIKSEKIYSYSDDFLSEIIEKLTNLKKKYLIKPKNNEFSNQLKSILGKSFDEKEMDDLIQAKSHDFKEKIQEKFKQRRNERIKYLGENQAQEIEKRIFLQTVDLNWKSHIQYLEQLRQVVSLRGYAQRDPLIEYKKEAFNLFENLLNKLKTDLITVLINLIVVEKPIEKPEEENKPIKNIPNLTGKKIGRNEPCFCGSGKKYKHCCGAL